MDIFEKLALRDLRIIKDDFTKHIVFTICIVLISSLVTYALIVLQIDKKIKSIPQAINKTTVVLPRPNEDSYTERGSPYDNRTVDGESTNIIFHGARNKKQIALTFDAEMTDGMKADLGAGKVKISYDHRIVDVLNKTHTKATLFLTGMWIELYPMLTEQLSNNSLFEIGSHSYTDSSYFGFCYGLHQLDNTVKIEEIGATEKLLREHAHIDNRLFRFPGGCYTPADVKLVNEANDTVVHWDIVGADGFNTNTQQIVHNVVDNAQNGSIVVLHMNGWPTAPNTADALPEIISGLQAKGFELVKVNELLGMSTEPRVP